MINILLFAGGMQGFRELRDAGTGNLLPGYPGIAADGLTPHSE
jgi:hypothetical protein